MSVYAQLGIRRVINASATLTRLGGSLMPPEVLAAMVDAAEWFVDLPDLQRRVGRRIADLTHNDDCYVSSGAAAGITIAVAACITGDDPDLIEAMPYLDGVQHTEVVVLRSQRNGYDYAARQTGVRLVEIEADPEELRRALTDRTACVLWFAGARYASETLSLAEVIAIAHGAGVPVLVDAAAQIPPIANLWHFTQELGADVAIFSGGKGLRGPQSSGLVLGRREIIEACRPNGSPNHGIGRPMKVGKEELAGILAAVEWSLAQDEAAILAGYERSVRRWVQGLSGIPGVTVARAYPSEAGQPHGRAVVTLGPGARLSRDRAVAALWERDPRVAVSPVGDDAIALNPQTLQPGEDEIVLAAVHDVLTG